MQKFKTLRQTLDLAEEEQLLEKLKASDPTGKWVSDFVHSDNPKFAGKSKKERIKMALGASYAAKRAEGKIKEEAELYEEEGFSPRGHRDLATHHFNKAKELYQKADSAENRGDSYGADHLNDVAGKHAWAYHAHKEASTDPKKSADAHKASREANDMIVDEYDVQLGEEMSHSELADKHQKLFQKNIHAAIRLKDDGLEDRANKHMDIAYKHADARDYHMKAAKNVNSESVELDESKHTLDNVLSKGESINDRIQKHIDAAGVHKAHAEKVDAKDPKDIEGYNRHASLTDLHMKASWSLRRQKKSPNGNHLKDYVATHKRIQDRYKKDPQLAREEVELDEDAKETQKRASELADKLRKKDPEKSKVYRNLAAKASQRSYNPTGVSRGKGPIGQGNKAQRRLGKEPVPSPMSSDRMRGYYEEVELDEGHAGAEKFSAEIYNKAVKSKKHIEIAPNVHFAKSKSIYEPHETSFRTSSGQHGYASHEPEGGSPTLKDVHHDLAKNNPHIKDSKSLKAVASAVHAHIKKNKLNEEVEELDEISAELAKRVAQARDKSAVDYDLTPTQSRRLKMGDKGGDPDMNAATALKSAMKRGAKNVYGEEVEHLDELSKKTLGSYINKAARGARMAGQTARDFDRHAKSARKPEYKAGAGELSQQYLQKAWKREDGIKAAVSKLTKEEVENKPGIHKVSVTINDKDKDDRDMKIEKMLKVKANNQAAALAIAKKHYGGKGYKVHNASYHGIHEEGRLSSGAKDPCWKNYEMVGTKKKNGREVPNCVPKKKD